ncbi:MAG: isoprenylcysteine carboxylmethyltransferase family protein [Clostridiales bacterium]|nr:isoprenylcysteine carboxylmethyltransferase family protein [Clostridiales bacterium]
MKIGILSWLAFLSWGVSEIIIVVRTVLLRRDIVSVKTDRGSAWLIRIAVYAGVTITFAFHAFHWGWVDQPIPDIGAVAMALGVALRVWSIMAFGKSFSTEVSIDADQELIKDGPYRWIRHPAYTGLLLVFSFMGLAFHSWLASCAIAAILLPCIVYRIRVEERALLSHFGSAYSEYCKTTWRLIPYLW